MVHETTCLPEVTTTPEFKARVQKACQTLHVAYDDVVIRLLEAWLNETADLDAEPDPDFVASAREALQSEAVQDAITRLGQQYDPHRTYPQAQPVS